MIADAWPVSFSTVSVIVLGGFWVRRVREIGAEGDPSLETEPFATGFGFEDVVSKSLILIVELDRDR